MTRDYSVSTGRDRPVDGDIGTASGRRQSLRLLGAPGASPHGGAGPEGRKAVGGAGRAGLSVGLLGPLAICGAAGELQPRQAELVAALALAGAGGLTAEVLRTRLGTDPDHPKDAVLFRQVITRTRRELGTAAGGGEYLIYDKAAARYRLDPAVHVDLDEFRALAGRGRAARDPRPLCGALALLRGRPLDGAYWWWLEVAAVDRLRAEAVDAAVLLARLALEAGDPVTARRAALSGLEVDPASEELWRQVMLAEDTAGSAAGVHRAWAMCRAAVADIALDGEPHPATAGLYRGLTSRGARQLPSVQGPADSRARLLSERRAGERAAG
jgi:DNA-binding SARP family transcriptional activator